MEMLILPFASAALAIFLFLMLQLFRGDNVLKHYPKKSISEENGQPRDLIDYRIYKMKGGQKVFYTLLAAGFLFALAYVFYHSLLISALLLPLSVLYPRIKSKELARKRKEKLSLEFREALYSLASSVSAGKSVEAAFKDAVRDLYLLYVGADSYIIKEFTVITTRIEMNETVEEALRDFAQRSGLEDVRSFADVFAAGKRSGGNMVDIIINTSNVIGDKLRIKEEINTLLAQRKLEQKILNAMPVFLILLLTWSTGDYMLPMFHTAFGRIVMTISVVLLAAAYYVSKKISDIEV